MSNNNELHSQQAAHSIHLKLRNQEAFLTISLNNLGDPNEKSSKHRKKDTS
tara:strand:- start:108 stop:260 length:153 start_codon:yes stop_codon:yes gene_type:complete